MTCLKAHTELAFVFLYLLRKDKGYCLIVC